jgi:hypothetical protein
MGYKYPTQKGYTIVTPTLAVKHDQKRKIRRKERMSMKKLFPDLWEVDADDP